MELIKKDEVIDFLNEKQIELDGWGDTDTALEVGNARLDISNWQPVLTLPENATNGNMIAAMFPNLIFSENEKERTVSGYAYNGHIKIMEFDLGWWKATSKAFKES